MNKSKGLWNIATYKQYTTKQCPFQELPWSNLILFFPQEGDGHVNKNPPENLMENDPAI